jgi:hypothetical protein
VPPILPPQSSYLFLDKAKFHASFAADVETGEKASGTFLIEQARLVATNVAGTVVKGSGHWLMEEARDQVIPAIAAFGTAPSSASLLCGRPDGPRLFATTFWVARGVVAKTLSSRRGVS